MTAVAAYIAIGANLNPQENILRGLEMLDRCVAITRLSRFYRSPPLERDGQPDFLNGVCAIRTSLRPLDLKFRVLRRVEQACGRFRTHDPHAPRPLDLDILLYGDRIISQPLVQIPDPDIVDRPFVFVPLHEIAGSLRLPGSRVDIASLCNDSSYGSLLPEEAFSESLRARFPQWMR